MSSEWDEHAKGWDDNPDVRRYAELALASLSGIGDLGDPSWKSKRVLDFGCGTGLLAELVAPQVAEVIAVDSSAKMVAALERKEISNVRAICADLVGEASPPPGDWFSDFDLILASSVCAFLPDYRGAVQTLAGALKEGGRFVQWDWLASGDDGFGLTEEQISDALEAADLSEIQVGHAFDMDADGEVMPVLYGTGLAGS